MYTIINSKTLSSYLLANQQVNQRVILIILSHYIVAHLVKFLGLIQNPTGNTGEKMQTSMKYIN